MTLVILDTSALTTHFFEENGWRMVQEFLDRNDANVTVAAPSLFEFHFVLKAKGLTSADLAEALEIYSNVFDDALSIDAAIARRAITLRESAGKRIPMTDALIAACAACHGATLVHRDAHMAMLPNKLVRQVRLPE